MDADPPVPPGPTMSEALPQPFPAVRSSRLQGTDTGTPAPVVPPAVGEPSPTTSLRPKVLRAAWLSIALGVSVELLLLAAATFGGSILRANPVVADLAQKVTWSVLVCVGIAFGTAAAKARGPVMGLLGLVSAPLAFNAARAVHKGVSHALSVTAVLTPGPAPVLLALLKSLEYGFLGAAVGWVGRRPRSSVAAYVGAGAAIGLTLGTLTLLVMSHDDDAATPASTLLARGINEVLFPIGCSLVLYAADRVGKHTAG
jgi:hypothetical protein